MTEFTIEEAGVRKAVGIDWGKSKFDAKQFWMEFHVEREGGDALTNVTNEDPILPGRIGLAHLNELPDYCTRLGRVEKQRRK